jgi:hypothetical protein
LSGTAPGKTLAGAGWALIEEKGQISSRMVGNPLDMALLNSEPGELVTLIAYRDDASFSKSQAARDGLTRTEHFKLLKKLALDLKSHGRAAEIKMFEVEYE